MPTKTKRTPPIVVDPNVERLMKGDMIAIRDMILGHVATVSEIRGVPVKEVRVKLWTNPEDDWEDVEFEIHLVGDQETAFAYWDGIADAIDESARGMSEDMLYTLNYHVGVGVEWL